MDGGFAKWTKEGRQCHGDAGVKGEDFNYKLNEDKLKTLENIKAFADNEAQRNFQLLDVRGPDQFNAGNIPGSTSFPVGKILNMDTKELKSAQDRKAAFEAAGVDLSKPISLSCQGGVAATVVFASLQDISTAPLSVYDGSWSQYS